MKPAKHNHSILHQVCTLIPPYLVVKLARKHGVDKKARTFSPWSHVVCMLHMQFSHALSLNDVCDTLRNHRSSLEKIRGATPPSRNGLSHANHVRNADMAEDLFWHMLAHIKETHPKFGVGHKYSGLPRRFTRMIYAIDSTTIKLVTNCISWAKHRRRKAAAKCHLRLCLQTFLPTFAIVKAANTHDASEARKLCANLKDGEIALFDKAYIDFAHLYELSQRGIFWVTRAKDNMSYTTVGQHREPKGDVLRDVLIELEAEKSQNAYPEYFRLVQSNVEINGEMKEMTFITNNLTWASSSICDLYRSRWGVEVFFKQMKQTLQLADFLGQSENAVRWQIWTAMLAYLLLRYIDFLSAWKGSFKRLFTLVRGVLFSRLNLHSVIKVCGTASGRGKKIEKPYQGFLPVVNGFP